MKKHFSRFLSIALALTLVLALAACGGDTGSQTSTPSATEPVGDAPEEVDLEVESGNTVSGDFIMATGGTAGTYYAYGAMICQLLNAATGSNISANSTGASVENIRLVADGEAELAIVQTDIQAYALEGSNSFEADGQITNVLAVASLYPEVVQVVTTDLSLNTIEDLRGKAVSVGAAGSGTEINARQFLEAYGMTYDDIDERFLSFAESGDALQDGNIAAAFIVAGTPNSAIQQLNISKPVKLLSVGDAERAALIEKYPFFAEHTVTSDVYGTDEDAVTLAIKAVLVASANMSEDDVYYLTKALFENQAELAQIHDKGTELSLDDCMIGVVPGNVHPGAARYFNEVGVATP